MTEVTGWLPWVVAAWLFGIGLYGIISSRHYVHLIGCLTVVQSSTYVLLLSIGYRHGAGPPFFHPAPLGTPAVDPVVQVLVLTDIVVGATVTALLLALVQQLQRRRGVVDPQQAKPLK